MRNNDVQGGELPNMVPPWGVMLIIRNSLICRLLYLRSGVFLCVAIADMTCLSLDEVNGVLLMVFVHVVLMF